MYVTNTTVFRLVRRQSRIPIAEAGWAPIHRAGDAEGQKADVDRLEALLRAMYDAADNYERTEGSEGADLEAFVVRANYRINPGSGGGGGFTDLATFPDLGWLADFHRQPDNLF